MCLAIPGRVISIIPGANALDIHGEIDFSGIKKTVSLAYVPEVELDQYVIVHAGFAISVLDEQEAQDSLAAFAELESLDDQS